jgi:hypothetical protein
MVKKIQLRVGDLYYTGLRNGKMGWRRIVAGRDGTRGCCGMMVDAQYVIRKGARTIVQCPVVIKYGEGGKWCCCGSDTFCGHLVPHTKK